MIENSLSQRPFAKALVIGPGAIGSFVGRTLTGMGWEVGFIGRKGPLAVAATFATAAGPEEHVWPAPDAAWRAEATLVFVAVKAFDLAAVLAPAVLRLVPPKAVIVTLVNGAIFALLEGVSEREPERVLRLGSCTIGVSRLADGQLAVRSSAGEISFGPYPTATPATAVEEALVAGGHGVFAWHPAIVQLHRRKWLYNTVINSLTAARGLPRNGDLLADMPTLAAVFSEALQLATALWGALPMSREALFDGLVQLIVKTADNENSMARDGRLRRRTESPFLAGLATDAAAYPLLTALHRQIGEREPSPLAAAGAPKV